MEMIYWTLLILMALYLIDYGIRQGLRKKGYSMVYVKIYRVNQGKSLTMNNGLNCHDNMILGRIFSEDILDYLYLDGELTALKQNLLVSGLNVNDYNSAFKEAFINAIIKLDTNDNEECNNQKLNTYNKPVLTKYCDRYGEVRGESEKIDSLSEYFGHIELLHKKYWKIFADMASEFPQFIEKIINNKESFLCTLYTNIDMKKKCTKFSLHKLHFEVNYETSELTNGDTFGIHDHFNSISSVKNKDHIHFIVDISLFCIKFFVKHSKINEINNIKEISNFSQSKFIYSFVEYISKCFKKMFIGKGHSNDLNGRRFTMVFSTLTVLEYLELNYSIPHKFYIRITKALKIIDKNVCDYAFDLWKKSRIQGTLEKINQSNQLKLKIMSHKNTAKLLAIYSDKCGALNRNIIEDSLSNYLQTKYVIRDRWSFENTIVEKITDACNDIKKLVTMSNDLLNILQSNQLNGTNQNKALELHAKYLNFFLEQLFVRIVKYQESRTYFITLNHFDNLHEAFEYIKLQRLAAENEYKDQMSQVSNETKANTCDDSVINDTTQSSSGTINAEFEYTKCIGTQTTSFSKAKRNKTEKLKTNKPTSREKLLAKIKEAKDKIRADELQ